jgi:hypothetical protein
VGEAGCSLSQTASRILRTVSLEPRLNCFCNTDTIQTNSNHEFLCTRSSHANELPPINYPALHAAHSKLDRAAGRFRHLRVLLELDDELQQVSRLSGIGLPGVLDTDHREGAEQRVQCIQVEGSVHTIWWLNARWLGG